MKLILWGGGDLLCLTRTTHTFEKWLVYNILRIYLSLFFSEERLFAFRAVSCQVRLGDRLRVSLVQDVRHLCINTTRHVCDISYSICVLVWWYLMCDDACGYSMRTERSRGTKKIPSYDIDYALSPPLALRRLLVQVSSFAWFSSVCVRAGERGGYEIRERSFTMFTPFEFRLALRCVTYHPHILLRHE